MVGNFDAIDIVEKLSKLCLAKVLSFGLVTEVKKKVLKQHQEEKNKEKIEDKQCHDLVN